MIAGESMRGRSVVRVGPEIAAKRICGELFRAKELRKRLGSAV
jgi:hypothetical protein